MRNKRRIEGGRELTVHRLDFLIVTSIFDYLRPLFKDKINITCDEYKQIVIWRMKDINSNLFKVRLSNLLAKCMGFNMSLEFLPLDVHVDEYAKITMVWEKSARAHPNHAQHYIEIAFSPGQPLVNDEKPEDYSVPVFFHVQCSLTDPTLVKDKFLNCLRTVEMNMNEEYKYLHHFVPKHIYHTSKSDNVSRDSYRFY